MFLEVVSIGGTDSELVAIGAIIRVTVRRRGSAEPEGSTIITLMSGEINVAVPVELIIKALDHAISTHQPVTSLKSFMQ